MIKNNQKQLNRIQVLLDAVTVALAYILSYYIRFYSIFVDSYELEVALPREVYFSVLYILIPAYLVLYNMTNLYTPRRAGKVGSEIRNIIEANILGALGFVAGLYIIHQEHFSRKLIAVFFVVNIIIMSLSRVSLRKILRFMRKKGYNLKHVLLVGYSRSAEAYISRIEENPQWGYVVNGVLDNRIPVGTAYHGVKVIGEIDQLSELISANSYDEIAITLSLDYYDLLEELVSCCEKSGVHTKFIPDYTSLFPSNPYTEDLEGLPVINIRYVPLTDTGNRIVKRIIDIIGALVAIILFSPIMLFAVIGIKLTSKGPIIFKQERVGLGGKNFMMYKFRTMEVQTKKEEAKGWTTKNDPRVTKIGRFLRSHNIDETPQFFNVLFGSMSLVGPRPERPQFVEKFREEIPRYMVKHQVRPGITGWAQVNGYRGDTSIRKRIDYDIYYIENWSVGFDMKILFGTFFHGKKNAY
ncbi:Undecaprenyl-phosphate glucose phosphotransferase [Butyrivibrio fibrisolvens DSM 3071]|uniref:Undecaprenyl-phosphate glucose phosphotransferase n=1 Tax=Butyrivibrio fibrisolvens DSM 3071 TaxID=1121131 RepID=A0A1M6G7S4_BUTFI|nr:undecaprenyl-phosphate glucose phosphotransferase [Butyrivibrio fibrisolvens]SHJ05979.1 Undecaprenyl-phosphate glucose phosphotransferase [Butyrivibrio fibrisolvens DSM 3071]